MAINSTQGCHGHTERTILFAVPSPCSLPLPRTLHICLPCSIAGFEEGGSEDMDEEERRMDALLRSAEKASGKEKGSRGKSSTAHEAVMYDDFFGDAGEQGLDEGVGDEIQEGEEESGADEGEEEVEGELSGEDEEAAERQLKSMPTKAKAGVQFYGR